MGERILIDDDTPFDVTHDPRFGRGYVERDYSKFPVSMFAPPSAIPLIPRSEWSARIKERQERKATVRDIRARSNGGKSWLCLNQGQYGYCWSHSTVHAIMLDRMLSNQPFVPLSAFAVAAIIKGGRNEGGWCGLSAQFATEVGVPDQQHWPQGTVNLRLDNEAMRLNASTHKIVSDFVDLTVPVWGRDLTFDQVMTCLLLSIPVAVDFHWWGHSVCAVDPVEVEPGSFGYDILNSWHLQPGVQEWGDHGYGTIRGSKAEPNGAVAIVSTTATAA